MSSIRTFRDGCVSFAEPCVTSVIIFEPDEPSKLKITWQTGVLDKIRFDRYVQEIKCRLHNVFEKKILHFRGCERNDHTKCQLY